jgi:hypothetical protein
VASIGNWTSSFFAEEAAVKRQLLLMLAVPLALGLHAASAPGQPAPSLPLGAGAADDSIAYAIHIADGNFLGVTLTNYGFLGNNFVSRSPSFEYPLGTGYDHLSRGGLWVGAQAIDDQGPFVGVSTGAIDGTTGASPQAGTEFTPAGLSFLERSSLPTSPFYDPFAISEQDLVCSFSDMPARTFSPENHRPLHVLVRQESYAWSDSALAHVLFLRYVIRNLGPPLANAWVGLYTELASGWKNEYSCWPPSASCGITGTWFKKKWVQYDDSLHLFREHYCYNLPVPTGCNLAHVPEWVGVKLLGARAGTDSASVLADTSFHVTMAAWKYSPGDTTRNEDIERYGIMKSGLIQDLSGPDFQPYTGDPVELLAVGPFAQIDSGDSLDVFFALVGGAEIADIQAHARAAQQAYDIHYTVPVQASLVSAEAEPGVARLRWFTAGGSSARWMVARSEDGAAWHRAGEAVADGSGYVVFEDRTVVAGRRYGYRLESPAGEALGEAWVDVPRNNSFALLGARPNPASPDGLNVSFSVAEAGVVTIEVFDASGRRVLARDLGSLQPGSRLVRLERARAMRAGTYFIRLRQGSRSATMRAVVLE